jgi:hypothetical protein
MQLFPLFPLKDVTMRRGPNHGGSNKVLVRRENNRKIQKPL